MPNPPADARADLVLAVQTVLAAAYAHLLRVGWRRTNGRRSNAARPGVRLVDALNYASAYAYTDLTTHRLAFACAAMAVEPHLGIAAHSLLPEPLADAYLSPDTDDTVLHVLDASIMVRCNATLITNTGDAADLLRVAADNVAQVVDAQVRYKRVPA